MATISADSSCCLVETVPQGCSRSERPTDLLVDRDIDKIVERKLLTNNFRVLHWSLNPLGETNGFLGQYYCLGVTVSVDNKSKCLKFFAKAQPPTTSAQYEFISRFDTFNKEIIVYEEIMSKANKGIELKWKPDYYLGKKDVIIVLEDATFEGYITPNKHVPFDEEHCVLVASVLSRLHSRSLILEEKLRRSVGRTIVDLYGHLLKEVLFAKDDERSQRILTSCVTGTNTLVDLIDELNDQEKLSIKKKISKWSAKLFSLLEPSTKFKNVMCHRDVWANNIMFKEDPTGKPIGCYLVDFQFLRYCPPAIDFLLFAYMTTDRATRDRCFDRFVDVYLETMRQELAAEGLNIEDHLSRAEFLQSCTELKPVALTYAILCLQVTLLSSSVMKEYLEGSNSKLEKVLYGSGRSAVVTHQYRTIPAYQARIKETILLIRDMLPDNPPDP